MGSGISLDYEQLSNIVKRDLVKEFNEKQVMFNPYTIEGYLIYTDFSEEQELKQRIQKINNFVELEKQKQRQIQAAKYKK